MDFTWSGLKFIDASNGALRRLVINGSIHFPTNFLAGLLRELSTFSSPYIESLLFVNECLRQAKRVWI